MSVLMIRLLLVPLPYMEYVILPENPRQLPVFLSTELHWTVGAMTGAPCQLDKLGRFSGSDLQVSVKCPHHERR
jgi:hypothetical protein